MVIETKSILLAILKYCSYWNMFHFWKAIHCKYLFLPIGLNSLPRDRRMKLDKFGQNSFGWFFQQLLERTMKRIWMLIGKSSRCKWASSHLSSCPVCPRPAAREKPVVRQLRNEWSPTTGHAALNVYIILDNAHIVQRTVIEIPKIYFEKGIVQRIWNGCNIFFPTSSSLQNYLLPSLIGLIG